MICETSYAAGGGGLATGCASIVVLMAVGIGSAAPTVRCVGRRPRGVVTVYVQLLAPQVRLDRARLLRRALPDDDHFLHDRPALDDELLAHDRHADDLLAVRRSLDG